MPSRAADVAESVQLLQWVLQWIPPVGVKCQWALVSVRGSATTQSAEAQGLFHCSMQRCPGDTALRLLQFLVAAPPYSRIVQPPGQPLQV